MQTGDRAARDGGHRPGQGAVAPELQLGDLLVREGLVARGELDEALRAQQSLGTYKPIGQILVERGALTARQLDFVLDRFHKRSRLGEVLVRAGVITPAQLEVALRRQAESGRRLGEVLLDLGAVNERTMKQALCAHLGIPFLDLDRITIHGGLTRVINRRYALKYGVVPVAQIGNTITLVLEDPTDAGVIAELEAATGCRINVVTSTRDAIRRAFARAYGEEPAPSPPRAAEPTTAAAESPAPPAPAGAPPEPPAADAEPAGPAAPAAAPGPRPAPVEVLQRIARDWEGFVRSVETLARERDEFRARWVELQQEYEAFQAAYERLRLEHETQGQALTESRAAHAGQIAARQAAEAALRELRAHHAALCRDRDHAADALEAVLRRLKP